MQPFTPKNLLAAGPEVYLLRDGVGPVSEQALLPLRQPPRLLPDRLDLQLPVRQDRHHSAVLPAGHHGLRQLRVRAVLRRRDRGLRDPSA